MSIFSSTRLLIIPVETLSMTLWFTVRLRRKHAGVALIGTHLNGRTD